ncbi:MAG: exo-alpha-sialidase [Opitutaceae bacterium]|nr:exo-alpha-sialidase [Opitutaceae bacterium]
MRALAFLALFAAVALRAAESPAITAQPIPTPTHANAVGAAVTRSPDGVVWLTWLEQAGPATALRFATLDAATLTWSPAGTIASGANWVVNGSAMPALTVGTRGRATALWSVRQASEAQAANGVTSTPGAEPHAWIAQTTDGGRTWSAGAPLTRESRRVGFASLATLADGRVLAAWLDGRAAAPGRPVTQLFARVVGVNELDTLIDPSVSEGCPTSLAAFPDGSALLAYRGRTADEVRDIRAARFAGGGWQPPHPVFHDGWKIAGNPDNGPQIAVDGGRVAAAWYTATHEAPRVLLALSPDAGERFLSPLQLNAGPTTGRVAVSLLHDGAMLVTSVDDRGELRLRRVTPDFTVAGEVRLTTSETGRIKGAPQVALLRDFLGGKTPAQLVVALVRDTQPAVLQTLLVSIPEGELLEDERNCDCAAAEEALLGFSLRGVIVAVQPAASTVRVRHAALPGLFAAGEREFAVSTAIPLGADTNGRSFIGRIRRHGDGWQVFSLRVLPTVP